MSLAAAIASFLLASYEPGSCYDALIAGTIVAQTESHGRAADRQPDEWPENWTSHWLLDVRVDRVLKGSLDAPEIRVASIHHGRARDRLKVRWFVRRTLDGSFDWISYAEAPNARLCLAS